MGLTNILLLSESKVQWHTYENKANVSMKVLARGLDSYCSEKYIIHDLVQKGFNIREVTSVMGKKH